MWCWFLRFSIGVVEEGNLLGVGLGSILCGTEGHRRRGTRQSFGQFSEIVELRSRLHGGFQLILRF